MKIIVDKPSSFFTIDKKLEILDDKGKIFYIHPNRQRNLTFNLPVGEYYTKNNIRKVGFIPYVKFEHAFDKKPVDGYSIEWGYNPHKATISPLFKKIVIDKKIRFKDGTTLNMDEYKPCLTFLVGHEIAHRKVGGNTYNKDGSIKFDAEKMCDYISENYMLSHGFNPSQVKICKQLLLSSPHRRNCEQYNPKQNNFRR